jgi:hypothetical protein
VEKISYRKEVKKMKKNVVAIALAVMAFVQCVGVAFAEDSALTTAINGWSNELTGYQTAALGICVSLFALFAGVRIAMKMIGHR